MKRNATIPVLTVIAACSIVASLQADEPNGVRPSPASLVGTWCKVAAKYGDATEFQETPVGKRNTYQLITPTHFMWFNLDPETKHITGSAGGTYALTGNTYTEWPQFGLGSDFEYVRDKKHTFTGRLEGDRWYQSGKLATGLKIDEIWERVKAGAVLGSPHDEKAKNVPPPSSALVGTWRMVALKEGDATEFHEFPVEERTGYMLINSTHFISFGVDAETKHLSRAMGGTYSVKGNTRTDRPQFGLGAIFEALRDKEHSFTDRLEGDRWYLSGKTASGLKIAQIWERVK